MKSITMTNYGPPEVLQFRDIPKPVPKDNEVLIKIYAASAHIGDTRIRRADPFFVRLVFGLFKPRKSYIPGIEVAGIIEEAGKEVTEFQKGDEVFALTGFGKGYAEYCCLPVNIKEGTQERKGQVVMKPENLSFEEAATVPAGVLTALKNLQKANIQPGQKILIYGASGSLGTFAIQLAKYYGAEVTAVCSAKNFELVKSLGADYVIDYTKEDFTEKGETYDIVYDAVMKLKSRNGKKVLKPGGTYLNNYGTPKIIEKDLWDIKELIEADKLKPVIDRIYKFEDVVEAHRYVDTHRKKGNVVLTVCDQ